MAAQHPAVLPQAPQDPSSLVPDFVSDFAEDVFGYLPRVDQRRWADAYLRGLLTVRGKKTIRQMARAVSPSSGAPQALQQFISASPWDWAAAREALARKAAARLPSHAWTIGMTLAEKRGEHSVGVHRRFVPDAGRTLNCQVGIGLFLTSGSESIPVDWRLLMDESWCGDEQRRRRARVPGTLRAQPVWEHVLDLTDRLAALRVSGPAPLVVDRCCAADAAHLAAQLNLREREFAIEIRPDQPVLPALHAGPGAGPRPSAVRPMSALQFMRDGGFRHPYVVGVEDHGHGPANGNGNGTGNVNGHGQDRGRQVRHLNVHSSLVRLPGRSGAPSTHRVYRLLAEQAPAHRRPARFWITTLVDRRMDEVLSLIRRPALTHAAVQRLEDDFGMLDFEGRSFPGWHHHMTMASAAYVYSRLQHGARQLATV
ncbi:IS701 family transposase [Streptomyces aureoversilis]|uniref:IS701 family transposase n=1 Tax=Streptomyces aureoversilis TaxID=67277 RepID=A0ABV9ZRJ4_9ACTN